MPVKKMKRENVEQIRAFESSGQFAYVPKKLEKFCVAMSGLHLDKRNPRINDDAAKELAALIRIHGFRKPIVVDQNGEIRAGNTAFKAAQILGMKTIPVAESDFDTTVGAVSYTISDNKASENSLWDQELLRELTIAHNLDKGENKVASGFSDRDIAKLFEIKKEMNIQHVLEVAVSCANEKEAETLFNRLTKDGYKCRVLSL